MTQYMFGTGQAFTTATDGKSPARMGALQDVSVDFSGDIKTLHGQYQFALSTARGKSKVEGKIGSANIDVKAYNDIYFGQPTNLATGTKRQVFGEAGAVPGSVTYTVTVANGANFYLDLGVRLVSTGAALKQVQSAPASGEYTVSAAGVYTFNVAQASAGVLIDYIYNDTTAGSTLQIGNNLMGITPYFQLILSHNFDNKVFTLGLYKIVADKLSLPLKQDDFLQPEISFQAQANDAGFIGFISTTSNTGGGA